jgi:putative acetyltransferase
MTMTMVSIQRADLGSDAVRALFSALDAELLERYPEEGANYFRLDAREVAPGQGAVMVAWAEAKAVGCGAIRRLNETDAEIKRMYVTPAFRSLGTGQALLDALEVEARQLGVSRLVLETGNRLPEAMALYERAGFAAIPRFGLYVDAPLSVCMAKSLR